MGAASRRRSRVSAGFPGTFGSVVHANGLDGPTGVDSRGIPWGDSRRNFMPCLGEFAATEAVVEAG